MHGGWSQLGDSSTQPRSQQLMIAVAAIAAVVVLVAQIPIALGLLDPDTLWEAHNARCVLVVNALLAVSTVVAAGTLPRRARPLALLPGVTVAAAMLLGAVTVGGHAWDVAMGALTMFAAWWIGRASLRVLGVARLQL